MDFGPAYAKRREGGRGDEKQKVALCLGLDDVEEKKSFFSPSSFFSLLFCVFCEPMK